MAWDPADLPSLDDQVVLVTGANSGIGLEAARLLASKGAHVLLGCRDLAKGERAVADVRSTSAGARVESLWLDLAELASVHAAAEAVAGRTDRLDVLVNNAGVMAPPERRTVDGFELQLGTNHLGHFALTGRLLPLLIASKAARVVTVSSGMHRIGSIDFEDLQWERGYDPWRAYGRSKLANLLFCYELQRRLREAHPHVISLACHPGYASTQLQTAGAAMSESRLMARLMSLGNAMFAQSAAHGAWPTVFAATAPGLRGGEFIGPRGLRLWGRPNVQRSSARSHDPALAARLWACSEELTGVRYLSSPAEAGGTRASP